MMELRRLGHLVALAEHGNFGRAATALYLTQPALSRSIQALEAEVGARLVDRRPTGVELTDIGRLVVRHAVELAAAADDLDREVRLAKGLELGELRIGAGPWGGAAMVAPVVGRLNARHPRLRLRVVVAPWRELPARLRARDVDIVVGSLGEIAPVPDFDHVRVSSHDTVVVGRRDHPLTTIDRPTTADLFAYPLAGAGPDSAGAEALTDLARAALDDPNTAVTDVFTIECDNAEVLTRILGESDVLAVLPRFVVDAEAERRLAVVPVDLGIRYHFGAAWLRNRSLGGAGAAFLELLCDGPADDPRP